GSVGAVLGGPGRPAGPAGGQASAPGHGVHRVGGTAGAVGSAAGGALREPGDPGARHRREPCARTQMRALLDVAGGRRPGCRSSHAVRSLRGSPPPAGMSYVLALAGVIVALDQLTKMMVLGRLVPGIPVTVADGWLALTLVMNPG